jgi:hypothetical protein
MSPETQLSNAERLARAVLLFHSPTGNDDKRRLWQALTGEEETTARSLCDFASRVRAEEEHAGTLDERVMAATKLLAAYHLRMARDSCAPDVVDYHTDLAQRMRLEIDSIPRRARGRLTDYSP